MKSLIVISLLFAIGCHKKPDAPAPSNNAPVSNPSNPQPNPPPPPPPPVNNCKGSTVLWEAFDTINDNSQKTLNIPGYEVSCGDSVRVYMRRVNMPGDPWTEYFNVDNGASYYSMNGQQITVYNKTGIVLSLYIAAILK